MSDLKGQPGRDHVFNLVIKDGDGAAQDLTLLDGYALIAYSDPKTPICKWSKNTITGFNEVLETDAAAGEVKILLPKEKTAKIDNVQLYIEMVAEVTDIDFDSLQLGMADGKNKKLIFITSSANTKVPALTGEGS